MDLPKRINIKLAKKSKTVCCAEKTFIMEIGNLSSNSNATRHGQRFIQSLDFAVPYTVVSGSFSLLGGVSNLLVMFVLLRYVGMKNNTHSYMFSLFLSDFLYNVVVQPQVCFYQFPSSTITTFGKLYIHGASLFCILTGIASLFFATLDKFIFIKMPFFYGNNVGKNTTRIVILSIWLACFALGVMRFMSIIFITHGYLAIIFTLFVLTIVVQIMIFATARDQDQRIQQLNRSLEHNHPGSSTAPTASHLWSTKAAKTIGLLLAIYIASWLPVNIYRLEYRWNGGDSAVYHKWVKIVNLLIQIHSCLNPWIFVFRAEDLKFAIGKMLRSFGVTCVYLGATETAFASSNVTHSSRAHSRENTFTSADINGEDSVEIGRDNMTMTAQNEERKSISVNENSAERDVVDIYC